MAREIKLGALCNCEVAYYFAIFVISSRGGRSLEEITPIRIFLIKDFFLFGSQVVGIVRKEIIYFLFVKSKQMFTYDTTILYPIDDIRFLVLVETEAHFNNQNLSSQSTQPHCGSS